MKSLKYLYDFGDGWEHTVKIERIADAVPGLIYPMLLDAKGRCPPEDVGGSWGYGDMLEILADPNHERYAETATWIGGTFDPTDPELNDLNEAVKALARKWARKPKPRTKPKPAQ